MSEERRKRQQERLGEAPKSNLLRNVVVGALVLAVFAGAYYLVNRRRGETYNAFAKCLATQKVKMYGLYWCTHCEGQKEMFGSAFQYVPYVECGIKGSNKETPACLEGGIKNFPTWEFADGSRFEGERKFEFLSEKSGCSLP